VPLLGFPPLYPTMFNSTSNPEGKSGNTGDSTSVFGEIYYDLTDSLKLTAGLRYNRGQEGSTGQRRAVQLRQSGHVR
jgi:outer membrane receptor protein involved in Fe transport